MPDLSPLDRYTFDTRGYLVFEDVLPPAAVSALQAAVAAQDRRCPVADLQQRMFGAGPA